jgi:3-hydroxyacyl-CoA dehydrogenase
LQPWVDEMLAGGATSFYKVEAGKRLYYDVPSNHTKNYRVAKLSSY